MSSQPMENPEREVGVRMLKDDAFREAMLNDPAATLEREFGVKVPEGVRVQVHEETEDVIHLVVPGRSASTKVSDDDLDDNVAEMRPSNPNKTNCCTCGASTAQTMSSWQAGCGCD